MKSPRKIAILVRQETSRKCIGKGCLRAFTHKKDSFQQYEGEEIELVGFCDDGGPSDDPHENIRLRIEKFKKMGVDTVHLSTCIRAKSQIYQEMIKAFEKEFEVVGYTHGSAVRRKKQKKKTVEQPIDSYG